jgi:hypothetical protein
MGYGTSQAKFPLLVDYYLVNRRHNPFLALRKEYGLANDELQRWYPACEIRVVEIPWLKLINVTNPGALCEWTVRY